MSDVKPLEPVDAGQCQCEEVTYNAFVMGGSPSKTIRCFGEPTVVVTENEEDEHGKKAAMSLCNKHLLAFIKVKGKGVMAYKLQSIEDWRLEE